jgi:hypothetical protein
MVGRFLAIQHRLNPLHMYCRCLDKGLSKRFSVYLCKSYEILIFIWVTRILRLIVRFFCVLLTRATMFGKRLRKDNETGQLRSYGNN